VESWVLERAGHEQVFAVEIAWTQAERIGAICGQGTHNFGLGIKEQLAEGLDLVDNGSCHGWSF
jgi:hypothetical protein